MYIYTHIDACTRYLCSTVPYEFAAPPVCFPTFMRLQMCVPERGWGCICVCAETLELLCIPDSLLWCRGSRLSYDSSSALSEISEVRHKRLQAERAAQRHTERNRLNKRMDTGLKIHCQVVAIPQKNIPSEKMCLLVTEHADGWSTEVHKAWN